MHYFPELTFKLDDSVDKHMRIEKLLRKSTTSASRNIMTASNQEEIQGILLVDKPGGQTAFSLVAALRRVFKVKKIGHAGTLDPFATGVMVMLIGRNYTKCSNDFLGQDKEYLAELSFGASTDTYDCDGKIIEESSIVPIKSK